MFRFAQHDRAGYDWVMPLKLWVGLGNAALDGSDGGASLDGGDGGASLDGNFPSIPFIPSYPFIPFLITNY